MTTADEPRWLTPEEQAAWLALVGMFIELPHALDAQLRRDSGFTHFEYQVLAELSDAPDRTVRMSDLAARTKGSLPRLSQVVRKLEGNGLVRRIPDSMDGRSTLATLTDEGFRALVDAAPGHVEAARNYVFDALTAREVRQLRDIGRKISAAIDTSVSSRDLPVSASPRGSGRRRSHPREDG